MDNIQGHHHVSMITKDVQLNNEFYSDILGLRRVKVTVNQDDPSMYHIFYGDKTGSPGTELSFFEMKNVGQTYRGTNAITKIVLLLPSKESLTYWKKRLDEFSIKHSGLTTYANRPTILFEDKEGLRLALTVDDGSKVDLWENWEDSPVPREHQIMGIGPIELTARRPEKLERTLIDLFKFTKVSEGESETVYQSVAGEPFGEIVVTYEEGKREKPGRGSVHHIAIRAKDVKELHVWDKLVRDYGFRSTGVIDRFYFHSLYFRESNGILFEIATDGPGFIVDGDIEKLGEQLDLPDFLEKHREEIVANLTPIKGLS